MAYNMQTKLQCAIGNQFSILFPRRIKMCNTKKVDKSQFDEYGFRVLGDEDEDGNAEVDPKIGASAGVLVSNIANKTLLPAEDNEKEKNK